MQKVNGELMVNGKFKWNGNGNGNALWARA
jgi:hypothetical protein